MSPTNLGDTIHQLRKDALLTLDQLSTSVGISRSTLVKIESGQTPDPGFKTIARLLAATGAAESTVLALHAMVTKAPRPVTSIGYERLTAQELVAALQQLRVGVVADVRLNPISRKPGLSKTALTRRLADAGIQYRHFRALGNPKDNRAGYADPYDSGPRAVFRGRLSSPEALQDLTELRRLVAETSVAVLCFEAEEKVCHRQQVLEALPG